MAPAPADAGAGRFFSVRTGASENPTKTLKIISSREIFIVRLPVAFAVRLPLSTRVLLADRLNKKPFQG